MKALSKLFYTIHWYGLSRRCDRATYTVLRLKDISVALEKMADAFEKLGETAKAMGGSGEANEEDTTTQTEE